MGSRSKLLVTRTAAPFRPTARTAALTKARNSRQARLVRLSASMKEPWEGSNPPPADFDASKIKIRYGGKAKFDQQRGVFRAYYGKQNVGYLMVDSYKSDDLEPDERGVFNTAVDPKWHRRGIATKLYDAAEAWLTEQGLKLVPTMGVAMHSVSDEAYKLWQKRSPEHPRVLDDARRYEDQYKDKPIRYKDQDWFIDHTAGVKGFTVRNAQDPKAATSRGWVPAAVVHEAYGLPGQAKQAAAAANDLSKITFVNDGTPTLTDTWVILATAPASMYPYSNRTTYNGGIQVGYIEVGPPYKAEDGTLMVYDVAVEDDWRGTGLGQALYDKAIEEAKKLGAVQFQSSNDQTPEAKKAWGRLKQRYPVKRDAKNGIYVMKIAKTAFISPRNAELTVAIEMGARPQVTIGLDLGIPNFTQFTITFPITDLSNAEVSMFSRQACSALLDDISAFLLSMKYTEDEIVDITSLAQECFTEITGKNATDSEMSDQDPTLRLYEGSFEMPLAFTDATYKKVVTAASVQRTPEVRHLELAVVDVKDPNGTPKQVIEFFRDQSTRNTPRAFSVEVHDSLLPKPKTRPADWGSRLIRANAC